MKKFEIKTDHFEFRFGKGKESIPTMTPYEVFDQYQMETTNDPRTVGVFDTIEEAEAEFDKNYANYATTKAQAGFVFWLLVGDVAWIEENEYDENGEFDQGGSVYSYSAMGYEKEDAEYFDQAVELMDDEIREEMHREGKWDTEEAFLSEYERRHFEKYGEEFTI